MNRIKQLIALTGASMTLMAASATTPALAGDVTVYTGSACQPSFEFYTAETKVTRFNGTIRNAADDTVSVECPIARHQNASTAGFTASVLVDNNVGAGIRLNCAIRSRDAQGNFLAGDADFTDQIGKKEITLDVANSVVNGTYELSCSLPQRSSVIRYLIDEK